MSDLRFFERGTRSDLQFCLGKAFELRDELALDKRDTKSTRRRNALKKVVANMTMGNDMSSLFPDVMSCIDLPYLESKKMVYLYLMYYGKHKADLAAEAVSTLSRVRTAQSNR